MFSKIVCQLILFLHLLNQLLLTQSVCKSSYKSLEDISLSNSTLKDTNKNTCISITNEDIIKSMYWLAMPPKVKCNNMTIIQGIAVCEDNISLFKINQIITSSSNRTSHDHDHDIDIRTNKKEKKCIIWSVLSSSGCDHYGSLAFEKYWSSRGCEVTIFHYYINYKGNTCSLPVGKMKDYPNITFNRLNMWISDQYECFNCFYKQVIKLISSRKNLKIDVLKLQGREGVNEDYDGVQFTVLSDLYLHVPTIVQFVEQIVVTISLNTRTLMDFVGRESEHAWNLFASQQLLQEYAVFSTDAQKGPTKIRPVQFTHLLSQARLDPQFSFYKQSFIKLKDPSVLSKHKQEFDNWLPAPPPYILKAIVPGYCRTPSYIEDLEMQEWIKQEMNVRCHPTRLTVNCIRSRKYDAILPCPQELMNNLAEDYAINSRWCNFSRPEAEILPLTKVDPKAALMFQKPSITSRTTVRLAFFFTIYTDALFVNRLFSRLYSPTHYYLFHLDASIGGVAIEFEEEIRNLANRYDNVFVSKDVSIVYGASTATILLTKAMAWFHKYTSGWDYFVPLTGSDYPLVPLTQIERIFAHQNPPMPFVMGWTPGTSTHIFRLQKTHPIFETDPYIVKSITAVTDERGKVLGAVPMEFRSNNFGPPLFCHNASNFAHLDSRQNKSGKILDTQWLFPKDKFPRRGRAIAEESPQYTTPSFDGIWRVWKKSDPATTGAYDKLSVDYIVNSEEGRKYWHFFKHMLLGSEEHYYISLLYNWQRTRAFVQTLSAEIVWNTWEIGLWEPQQGFQTHTHFLTLNEWDILVGFSKRGMMFARKFSSHKTAALLDKIDAVMLLNKTSDAGMYWPGFYEVDVISPGKQWVAMYRKNQSLLLNRKKAVKQALGKYRNTVTI